MFLQSVSEGQWGQYVARSVVTGSCFCTDLRSSVSKPVKVCGAKIPSIQVFTAGLTSLLLKAGLTFLNTAVLTTISIFSTILHTHPNNAQDIVFKTMFPVTP